MGEWLVWWSYIRGTTPWNLASWDIVEGVAGKEYPDVLAVRQLSELERLWGNLSGGTPLKFLHPKEEGNRAYNSTGLGRV